MYPYFDATVIFFYYKVVKLIDSGNIINIYLQYINPKQVKL